MAEEQKIVLERIQERRTIGVGEGMPRYRVIETIGDPMMKNRAFGRFDPIVVGGCIWQCYLADLEKRGIIVEFKSR